MQALNAITRILTKRAVIVPFGLGLGFLFGFLAVRGIDWAEVGRQIAGTSVWAVIASFGFTLFSGYLRAVRWRLLFVGERITTLRLFLVENAALGLNNVSPVRLLDEPAIIAMLTLRDKIPAPPVLATIVMTRAQDVAVTLLFAAAAVAAEPALTGRARPAALGGLLFMVFLFALLNLGGLARWFPPIARIPGVARYAESVATLVAHRMRLAFSTGLTGAYWLALGPAAYVLAQAMGVEITWFQATIVALGAVFFASATPGLPGAIGTFELAVVEIVGLWGVPQSLGVGYALILHVVFFLPPMIMAVIVLPREGISFLGRGGTPEPRHAE